ncbi:MAG: restriction endonuclease subunit S [Candidatus Methylumidiphilus sp.]
MSDKQKSHKSTINSPSIPPGYKQTEVGVIPEDWEIKPLHARADKIMVGIASAATHAYRDRGIPMFRNQNIKPNRLDDTDILYIAEDYEVAFKNKRLKSGDLLTARTGYPGTTSIVPIQYEGAQSFTTLITRPIRNLVDSNYLCCLINSKAGQTYFEQNKIGGGQKNVNAGSLKFLPVPLPPTKAEQEAIAEALSDADAFIESLEQLIAKKRHIKQGAVQELLTGKKRLPGFSGEWEVKRLDDVAEIVMGQSPDSSSYNIKGLGLPLIQGNADIENRRTKKRVFTTKLTKPGRCGDILMSVRAPVGEISRTYFDVCLGRGVCAIRYTNDFLYHYLVFIEPSWASRSKGSTFDSVNSTDVKSLEIEFPNDFDEQPAIASILSDMDAEIDALETKLTKARHIKHGMMHNGSLGFRMVGNPL